MRGFQPSKTKAKPFANGGPVRGPGTGTSDEVQDQVPEGTYIMPTDSTQAIGEKNLAAMGARGFSPGRDKIPVQLSNGEFKLPPEQVHAIGVQALDQVKDATHQPVTARGFAPGAKNTEPPIFFSDGGAVPQARGLRPRGYFDGGPVVDERKKANSFGDAAAATSNPGVTQVGAPPSAPPQPANTGGASGSWGSPAQSQPTAAPTTPAASSARGFAPGMQSVLSGGIADAKEAVSKGDYGAAVGHGLRAGLAMVPAAADDALSGAAVALNPAANALKTAVTGDSTPIGSAPLTTLPTATAAPKPAPSIAAPGSSIDRIAPAGAARAPQSGGSEVATGQAPAPQNNISKTVDAQGRTTYSGSNIGPGATINGKEAGGGYMEVPGMTDRGFAPGVRGGIGIQTPMGTFQSADNAIMAANLRDGVDVSRGTSAGGGPRGFVIGSVPRQAGDRGDLMDSLTSVVPGARGLTAAQRNGMLQLMDQEARGQQARANNATALQQTEMQTATQRDTTAMREAGESGRAIARNAIDQGRLNLEQQARGFEIRDGQRKEKLYEKYDAAKTPEERSAVAQQVRDLSGKQEPNEWRGVELNGGVDAMGNKQPSQLALVNARTGETRVPGAGQGGAKEAAPTEVGQRKAGTVYSLPNGKLGRWTSQGWELVG